MSPAEVLEQRINEARVYAARGTQNHHDEAIIALADIRTSLMQQAEKLERQETDRCLGWALAYRRGDIEEIRDLCDGISSGLTWELSQALP